MVDTLNFELFLLNSERARRQEERRRKALRNLTDEQLEQCIKEKEAQKRELQNLNGNNTVGGRR